MRFQQKTVTEPFRLPTPALVLIQRSGLDGSSSSSHLHRFLGSSEDVLLAEVRVPLGTSRVWRPSKEAGEWRLFLCRAAHQEASHPRSAAGHCCYANTARHTDFLGAFWDGYRTKSVAQTPFAVDQDLMARNIVLSEGLGVFQHYVNGVFAQTFSINAFKFTAPRNYSIIGVTTATVHYRIHFIVVRHRNNEE